MKKTTDWKSQRKKELRRFIRETTRKRRILLKEQRDYKIELLDLKEGENG